MDNCSNSTNNSKVSFDPGWNDPPKISYNATQSLSNRPRNFLNKRVAFPLSGTSPSPATVTPFNLPPIPAVTPGPHSVLGNTQQQTEPSLSSTELDSENTLVEVKKILIQLLECSCELGPKSNDIKRRLELMEQMWTDGKLSVDVQKQMKDLAIAIKDDKPDKADEIHKALMVNHVSAVGTWMPGIKQLIHHSIARSQLLAIDREETNALCE